MYKILKEKNALLKSIYYVTEYKIFRLFNLCLHRKNPSCKKKTVSASVVFVSNVICIIIMGRSKQSAVLKVVILGAFAKLRKVNISFVISVHLSVRMKRLRSHCTDCWLRYCAISRKVAGSIPDGVIDLILPAAV